MFCESPAFMREAALSCGKEALKLARSPLLGFRELVLCVDVSLSGTKILGARKEVV